ncbi:hypothetical protein H4R33_003115 [Dimargaris cristalligena]|nr:hypothetical protein H4R33_003115 [Dimargaris cristalligena]
MEEAIRLPAQHLTPAAYAPFGRVIDASALTQTPEAGISANQNTARRLNAVSPLTNLRPEGKTEREPAQPNLCLFRCSPRAERPFPVRLLERHPFSTQMFMPIAGPSPKGTPGTSPSKKGYAHPARTPEDYLVIVAENGTAGIGVWHLAPPDGGIASGFSGCITTTCGACYVGRWQA